LVRADDFGHHSIGQLVLPESEHRPTSFFKSRRVSDVALTIPLNLRVPIVGVLDGWTLPVLWAAMPEAAIAEHGDPVPREHDVWPDRTGLANADRQVDPESKTSLMKERADGQLEFGIAASYSRHVARPSGRGRWG
jgi:hypothetical protein